MTKTFYDVKQLKENWRGDPTWPIEDTLGFEDHKQELKAYRLEMQALWLKKETDRLLKRALQLCCSVELVKYIEVMEYRLGRVELQLEKHQNAEMAS
jgi:hypothetical protein